VRASLHRKKIEEIPWCMYDFLLPRGDFEREARNCGLGLCVRRPVSYESMPNVRIEEINIAGQPLERRYCTPLGTVTMKLKYGIGSDWNELRMDWEHGAMPWITEHLIKSVDDYKVLEYIIQNITIHPYPKAFLNAEKFVGEDGVVIIRTWKSPFQSLLIEYVGPQRLFVDLYKHPKEVNVVLETLERKQDELYEIIADSPAEIIMCPDNIDSMLISPRLFEKYCLPFYNKQARLLHSKGKLFGVHMDGRLKNLASLIREAEIDFVEAFTPPPMGDLTIGEVKRMWGEKIVTWINFPSTVCLFGYEEVKRYGEALLRDIAPGDGFLFGITENIKYEVIRESLKAFSELIRKSTYPITI
ncbi:MAG: uroporphyrinogen decarboxylase family protein, partial [Nitrososphaerota archaeon]